jgi:hypothetical protein
MKDSNSDALNVKFVGAYNKGKNLCQEDADKLKAQLTQEPSILEARCCLLGFHSNTQSASSTRLWVRHAKWLISGFAGETFTRLILRPPSNISKQQTEALFRVWTTACGRSARNANVFGNAASFFRWFSDDMAEPYYKKAKRLEPNNYLWAKALVHLYVRRARLELNEDRKRALLLAFKDGDAFVQRFHNEPHHMVQTYEVLESLSKLALDFGRLKRASRYIESITQLTDDFAGQAKNVSTLLRGRLALKRGDLSKAKNYLLRAGKLGFSRDLTLARELSERGEIRAVEKYLELCSTRPDISEMDSVRLKEWRKQLKQGQQPDLRFTKNRSQDKAMERYERD